MDHTDRETYEYIGEGAHSRATEHILGDQVHDVDGITREEAKKYFDLWEKDMITKVAVERILWGDHTSNSPRVSNLWRKFGWKSVKPRHCRDCNCTNKGELK